MEYEADLEAIRREMDDDLVKFKDDPVLTAEEQTERRCDYILRDLDELVAMAANSETVDLVEGQKVLVGMICTRAQLLASFLNMRQAGKLRVVSNG